MSILLMFKYNKFGGWHSWYQIHLMLEEKNRYRVKSYWEYDIYRGRGITVNLHRNYTITFQIIIIHLDSVAIAHADKKAAIATYILMIAT